MTGWESCCRSCTSVFSYPLENTSSSELIFLYSNFKLDQISFFSFSRTNYFSRGMPNYSFNKLQCDFPRMVPICFTSFSIRVTRTTDAGPTCTYISQVQHAKTSKMFGMVWNGAWKQLNNVRQQHSKSDNTLVERLYNNYQS